MPFAAVSAALLAASHMASHGPLPPPRAPIALWGRTEEGMSPAQVQALYPEAKPPAAPAGKPGTATWTTDQNTLRDGAVARLTYRTELSTGPVEVVFYFIGEGLDSVLLHVLNVKPGAADDLAVARQVRDLLAETYGPPQVNQEVSDGGLTRINAQWTRQPLKVSLGYQDLGGRRVSLWVAYHTWRWNRR